jgi:predicted ArsR family transcriptional regulator
MSEEWIRKAVDQFVLNEIDSVSHLEALLMLWNNRPKPWTVEQMAKALYVAPPAAQGILQDLTRRGLIVAGPDPDHYHYESQSEDRDALMASVDYVYRRELVRISQMIHGKGPSSVREFARAFRFTKEKEKDNE